MVDELESLLLDDALVLLDDALVLLVEEDEPVVELDALLELVFDEEDEFEELAPISSPLIIASTSLKLSISYSVCTGTVTRPRSLSILYASVINTVFIAPVRSISPFTATLSIASLIGSIISERASFTALHTFRFAYLIRDVFSAVAIAVKSGIATERFGKSFKTLKQPPELATSKILSVFGIAEAKVFRS